MPKPEPLRADRVRRRVLQTSSFWKEVVYLDEVESTNDLAKDLASEGAPGGTVVIADLQTSGRGRLRRRWIAPARTSVLCSLLFRPGLRPEQGHRLTMLCSMAAADAIQEVAGLAVALKWPNDLVARPPIPEAQTSGWQKLAGVLTETGLAYDEDNNSPVLTFVVVGIGINVNVPRAAARGLGPNATSIMAATGLRVDRAALLLALLDAAEVRYERLEHGENPREEWSARLVTLGHRVQATTSDGAIEGIAEAVDENGALLLRTQHGSLRRLVAGDVTLAPG